MRASDLFQKYRISINAPYRRKDLISILGTLFILLALPITVFVVTQARPWGPKAAGTAAAPTTIGSIIEPGSMVTEANYIVFVDGSNYYARNGKTGEIQFSGGGDATPVIQAAIDALPASGGKVVLTEGTFNLSNSIMLGSKGTTLQGQGYSTLIQYDDTIAGMGAVAHHNGTTYRQVSDATVRDLRIKNTDTHSEKSAIGIGWDDNIAQRITIDHVEADGGNISIWCGSNHRIEHSYAHDIRTGGIPVDSAIAIRGAGTTLAYDSIIANNLVDNISDMGIFSILTDGLSILNNRIRNVNQRKPPTHDIFAIDTATSVNILIAGNNIESSSGINSEGNTPTSAAGTVSIVGNIIKGTSNTVGVGIQVWRVAGGWPAFDRVLIQGNTISGSFWGIHVGDEDKVAIIGNVIDSVGDDGIRVDKAVYTTDPTAVLIEGNTILDWAAVTAWRLAISANVANVKVSDNYMDGDSLNNNRGIAGLRRPGWITDNVIQNVGNVKMFEIEAGVIVENNY